MEAINNWFLDPWAKKKIENEFRRHLKRNKTKQNIKHSIPRLAEYYKSNIKRKVYRISPNNLTLQLKEQEKEEHISPKKLTEGKK